MNESSRQLSRCRFATSYSLCMLLYESNHKSQNGVTPSRPRIRRFEATAAPIPRVLGRVLITNHLKAIRPFQRRCIYYQWWRYAQPHHLLPQEDRSALLVSLDD
ncbi:hypothetical protein AVEN_179696-1 [Araneus ventricosus]|uniref:Uncharacterized protein n=1 Tax=Araneus ventricosus TaxID=182803 RepID=A0A4Y2SCN3_ARAVE|nr:hypothetical protein AVEN_179696-1 [Araneus ventricosus]